MSEKLQAFRFTITRNYYGVIAARTEDEARAALDSGAIDELDCTGGDADVSLTDATPDDIESADENECLFNVRGGSASVDEIELDDEPAEWYDDDSTPTPEAGAHG